MEVFFPTLEGKIATLVAAFRFVVFVIMVAGLIGHIASGRAEGAGLFAPLARAIVITAVIAYEDRWFPRAEYTLLSVAEFINPGYNEGPTAVADEVRESTTRDPGGREWSWRRLNESLYQSIVNGLANMFIYIGTLLTVPMLILQYVLRWLLYLLAPFALATFMVPGLTSIGVRFLQQTLAVLSWPVGFAMTNLVALAVWRDFTAAVVPNPETVEDVVYAPLLSLMGGLLTTIMLVVGMVSTPIVMQALFAHGHAFTGAAGNPVATVRGSVYALGWRGGKRDKDREQRRDGSGGSGGGPGSAGALSPPPAPIGATARPSI